MANTPMPVPTPMAHQLQQSSPMTAAVTSYSQGMLPNDMMNAPAMDGTTGTG